MTSPTTYESDDTALLIVDPYNDFMSKGGKYYERTKETADAVGFYDNMRPDYKGWKHVNASQLHISQVQGFAAGTWGGEFNPLLGYV